MSQLSENITLLAKEDNQFFIQRSYGIIPNLDNKLQKYAISLIKELERSSSIRECSVLFIPISHKHIFGKNEENSIKLDIANILGIEFKEGDIIIIGETIDGEYTIKNREVQILTTLKELETLGLISLGMSDHNNPMISHLHGFEKAIFDFAEEKKIQIYGVESIEGAIIATALESGIQFVKNDDDGSFHNELKYRIGMEGRTRLSLNRANNRFKSAKRIIFVQGALHLEGIKEWCKRNNCEFQVIVPNTIKSHFKGKNINLQFVY